MPRRRSLHFLHLRFLLTLTVSGLQLAAPASAQLAAPAAVRQAVDANGVDLFQGTMVVDGPALTIGRGATQSLSYYKLYRGSGWTDNVVATMNLIGSSMTVTLGGTSDSFSIVGGNYVATQGNGATLVF